MSKRGRGAEEERQLWGKRSENNLRQNQSQGGHLRVALPVRALPALAIEASEEPLILKGGFQDLALTCRTLFKLYSASVRSFSFKTIHCFQGSGKIHCGAKTRWENVKQHAEYSVPGESPNAAIWRQGSWGCRWKTVRGLVQVAASTGSSGCCKKRSNTGYTHFAVVLVSGVGNGKVVWFICSVLK